MSHEALIAIRPICITTYAVGPPPAEPATALAKQGRTTGEVLEVGVAPIPTVPGASPARETATILSSELDSPPDHPGLVPRARRTTLRRTCSNRLQQEVAAARGAAISLPSHLTDKG